MDQLFQNFSININQKIYVKDPETTALGKKILQQSILSIHQMGFDHFTFKKLGQEIGSNESSIYRYFENKHKLLIYLFSWYWSWIEYRMVNETQNILNPTEKLQKTLEIVTEKIQDDQSTSYINESLLSEIIILEIGKTMQTKEVTQENKDGFFGIYKRVINRLVDIISQVNPEYPYAKSLASNIIEGALHQHFLKKHLTTITNCDENISPSDFYNHLVTKILSS